MAATRPARWFFKRSDGRWQPYSGEDSAIIDLADAADAQGCASLQVLGFGGVLSLVGRAPTR